jgi:hypothetical protein
VALALLDAAKAGPADVKTLAMRARVGFGLARCTASRLVSRGKLTADRSVHPALLSLPDPEAADAPRSTAQFLHDWMRAR